MSNEDTRTQLAPPPSVGQEIDTLTQEFPRLQTATEGAAAALERCQERERKALDRLVELLGRPTAAKMLGLTPRELAGMLRGRSE